MGLSKYQKHDFTNSTVAFYQKSIFDFLNPFRNIPDHLNLWNVFMFIFRQLRMTFFHRIMVAVNIPGYLNLWDVFRFIFRQLKMTFS